MRREEREEYDQYLRRLEDQHRQHMEQIRKALENSGLEIEGEVVRYAESRPGTSIAPTWEAQRLAQIRTYEAETRISDIEKIARRGVQAVIAVHSDINANESMHPAFENGLREIEDETKKAAIFLIGKHAGYVDDRANNGHYR